MLRTAVSRHAALTAAASVAVFGLALTAGPAAAAPPAQGAQGVRATSAAAPVGAPVRHAHRHTAAEIHRFLTRFYGDHGPSEWAREHRVSDYLKERAAHTEGYDLLLCAQNTPEDISVGDVTTAQSAGAGWATVTTYWGGHRQGSFTAYVYLDSHPIELQDVDCGF